MDKGEDESHVVGVIAIEKSIATIVICVALVVSPPHRFNDQNLNSTRQGKLGNAMKLGDGGVNG